MAPEEIRASLREQPFQPFRLLMSDGTHHDIRHPDLLWIGLTTAYVGLTGEPGQTFFERSVKIDLRHVTQLVPLEAIPAPGKNGQA
ncbi:MAG: hypothetical protein K2W96_12540 [Gemmataceae bacterium]|nr:hypothetical protein [Gemmataceae bacterium]